jgi:hypothetical protein
MHFALICFVPPHRIHRLLCSPCGHWYICFTDTTATSISMLIRRPPVMAEGLVQYIYIYIYMYVYIRMYVRVYVTTLRCWCLPLHSRWGMDTQCGRTDPAADAAVAQVSPVLVDIDSSMGESKHPFSHPFFQMQLPAYGPSVNTSQSHVF